MLHANLDRTYAGLNTKAPFAYECGLHIGPWSFPNGSILGILVECDEKDVPPARLALIESEREKLTVTFSGADGNEICQWRNDTSEILQTPVYAFDGKEYCSAFLTGDGNMVKGHIVFEKTLPRLLHDMARRSGSSIRPSTNDFVLLPQCHVSWSPRKCRRFTINGKPVYGDLNICQGEHARIEYDHGNIAFGIAGDYVVSESPKNTITTLQVGNDTFDCTGKYLYMYASPTSNIRVATRYTGLEIGSVLDVQ